MATGRGGADCVRTACSYCGVGCGIEVRTTPGPAGPVIAGVAGDPLHPTNRGRLCTKGATHAELMGSTKGRALTALIRPRRGEPPVPAPVDDAVAAAGQRLRAILDTHGPDAIALYVSGQLSLEAQYLATKLTKGFIRTVHLEANSRLCMASAASGYKQSLGADGPPGSYDDIDRADLFFVIGANMADCHPILYLRMADRLRAGAKLIVVDPRRTATAANADLFLQIRPGTDLALLNGLLHLLVAAGDIDTDFIAEHTEGWEAMPDFLADYPPERVAAITGLPPADIRTAAAMIAEAGTWMSLWTMGLNQSTHGTWNTNALCNLHLATGAICRPGTGPLSLTGQPNAMGGREMGYLGAGLPGQRTVASAADRAFTESIWGLPAGTIRAETNRGTIDMFEQLATGTVKAAWTVPAVAPAARPFTRTNPVHAKMSVNRRLTPPAAAREVRQFGFDIAEHAVEYDVGDALGVIPVNSPVDVENWLWATGLSGARLIEVDGAECTLREALETRYDICALTPNLLTFLADAAADRAIARRLRAAIRESGRRRGRNGIDVIREVGVRADVRQWQDALVRLTPRFYSISSSPLVSPHEVQLTVSVVRYTGPDGTPRGGVCSTYLADRAADTATGVFLQPAPHFRPPADGDTPIVMIGAGTGIAPFRGFLQHRRTLGHTGRNWLIFGDRRRVENFYYSDELTGFVDDGLLTRFDLAFSRDQPQRIYVQDRMIEHGAELWRWLCDGARLYVCGDASTMAAGVDRALTDIVATHGRLGAEAVRDYKRNLIADKRYLRDVY
ncbi:molybdopterin-dependent oxidoreductase [Mycolicibacterium thermoresistibile]